MFDGKFINQKKYKQSLIERFFERYPATNNIRFSMKILRAPERGGFNNIINAEYCGCWGAQNVCDLCRCRGNRISFYQGFAWPKQCANRSGLLWAKRQFL
jgi:hypothetical protein